MDRSTNNEKTKTVAVLDIYGLTSYVGTTGTFKLKEGTSLSFLLLLLLAQSIGVVLLVAAKQNKASKQTNQNHKLSLFCNSPCMVFTTGV